MIIRAEETYLTATETAKHLGVARGTFYRQYKKSLQEYIVGMRKRIHYRLAEVEELSQVRIAEKQVRSLALVREVAS